MKSGYIASTRFAILASQVVQVLLLLSVAGFGAWGAQRMGREEDYEYYKAIGLIRGAGELQYNSEHEIAEMRGFLVQGAIRIPHGDEPTVGRYQYELAQLTQSATLPGDRTRLARIRADGDRYLAYRNRLEKLLRAGQGPAAIQLARHAGRPLTHAWRAGISTFVNAAKARVEVIHKQDDETEVQVKYVLALVPSVQIPLALVLALLLARRVLTPLDELERGSKSLAAGDLGRRVSEERGDEFGRVAQAFNSMAEQVEGSVTALASANQALRELDRTKDEFLSVTSHELKTPLGAIKGFASLLGGQYAGGMSETQLQYLANIEQSADRLIRLVGELLDVATIRAGKLSLDAQEHHYGLLVEDVLETMQPVAAERGVDLLATLSVRPTVALDYDLITRVLTNLIANAIKFTPKGGRVEVYVEARGESLLTEVRDTGVGVAPDDIAKLFKPFVQLDMSSARRASGTGLGLAISKALVEAHGGTIGLRARAGGGSIFWFVLPLLLVVAVPEVKLRQRGEIEDELENPVG